MLYYDIEDRLLCLWACWIFRNLPVLNCDFESRKMRTKDHKGIHKKKKPYHVPKALRQPPTVKTKHGGHRRYDCTNIECPFSQKAVNSYDGEVSGKCNTCLREERKKAKSFMKVPKMIECS